MGNEGNRLSEEQVWMIRELAATGMKQKEIAKRVGCSRMTVSRRLSEMRGTQTVEPSRSKTLTPEEQADLMSMVADGYELEELAPGFGCDVDTLAYYVRKLKRSEMREKEREDKIVCGDKFNGLLLDRGNGDYHGTFRNADGTFEHMDLRGVSRDDAKAEYERWRSVMSDRDETYSAVFDKKKPEAEEEKPTTTVEHFMGKVYLVMRDAVSVVPFVDEESAFDLAAKVESLTGQRMTVMEVPV